MAENASELDIIKHLLEIEKSAADLIDEAKVEADKRLSEARSKYNSEFKEKYDVLIEKLESEYKQKVSEIEAAHEKEIEEFKASLDAKEQYKDKFNTLLDSYLFSNK